MSNVYVSSNSKAGEAKDSAYALLIVGIIGMVADILTFLGYIPLGMSAVRRGISCGILGIFFLALIICGLVSFKSIKRLRASGTKENELELAIKKWAGDNLSMENIDEKAHIDSNNADNEENFFKRNEIIKKEICNKFLNLDDGYLDYISEIIYTDIYEN